VFLHSTTNGTTHKSPTSFTPCWAWRRAFSGDVGSKNSPSGVKSPNSRLRKFANSDSHRVPRRLFGLATCFLLLQQAHICATRVGDPDRLSKRGPVDSAKRGTVHVHAIVRAEKPQDSPGGSAVFRHYVMQGYLLSCLPA